ncbi:hypothetical protein, conserved [Eimeria brunetti]|uniref:C2HC/C3H-type domain-containing protein n=1 Tax=Eimeria brunetti TaxID=51314 RepID=U6LQN5_9EIME|nr:hypothetical protein, conserved [Eimeria brunetti]
MAPRSVQCNLCGRQVLISSMSIHQKTCAEKQQHIFLNCQHCGIEVPKPKLEQHLLRCPKRPAAAAAAAAGPAAPAAAAAAAAAAVFDDKGRLQCAVCSRWFAADRVSIHQNICQKIAAKRRQPFDSFKQRRFDPLIQRVSKEQQQQQRLQHQQQRQQRHQQRQQQQQQQLQLQQQQQQQRLNPRRPGGLEPDSPVYRQHQRAAAAVGSSRPAAAAAAAAAARRGPAAPAAAAARPSVAAASRPSFAAARPAAAAARPPAAATAAAAAAAARRPPGGAPGGRGPMAGGPLLQTNECSADNPLAYPNYPTYST